MSENRPTIPAGDFLRRLNLPPWALKFLNFFRGWKIKAGPVDVQLNQKPGAATPPRSGLDQPGTFNPPRIGGPRR